MCVVSMIADDWRKRTTEQHPWVVPYIEPWVPTKTAPSDIKITLLPEQPAATKQDIEDLRKELNELKKLLKAAGEYDAATGQPNCEQEEKIKAFRILAKLLDVDLKDVLPAEPDTVADMMRDPRTFYADPAGTQITSNDPPLMDFRLGSPVVGVGTAVGTTFGGPAWSNNVSWSVTKDLRQPWASRDDGSHP